MTKDPAPVVDTSDKQWHLDRKVPIALILSLAINSATVIWFGAKLDSRVETLERQSSISAPTATEQGTRLTRVEVKVDNLIDGLTEIKSILRKEPMPQKSR